MASTIQTEAAMPLPLHSETFEAWAKLCSSIIPDSDKLPNATHEDQAEQMAWRRFRESRSQEQDTGAVEFIRRRTARRVIEQCANLVEQGGDAAGIRAMLNEFNIPPEPSR